ncbi:MAG: hypothetical protein AAFN78_03625 [Pseudomonadota bacterium]
MPALATDEWSITSRWQNGDELPGVNINVFNFNWSTVAGDTEFTAWVSDFSENPLTALTPDSEITKVYDSDTDVDNSPHKLDLTLSVSASKLGDSGPNSGIGLAVNAFTANFSGVGTFYALWDTETLGLTSLEELGRTGLPLADGELYQSPSASYTSEGTVCLTNQMITTDVGLGLYCGHPALAELLEPVTKAGDENPVIGEIQFVTQPSLSRLGAAYQAGGQNGNAVLYRLFNFRSPKRDGDTTPQLVTEIGNTALKRPSQVEIDGEANIIWQEQDQQGQTRFRRIKVGETLSSVLAESGEPLDDGDAIVDIASIFPFVGTSIGTDVCVFYQAFRASAPFPIGDLHLAVTCEATDGSKTTDIVFSYGQMVDGETISSIEIWPDSADGARIVFKGFTATGGEVLLVATQESDSDGDGLPDATDNCTAVANADQRDSNADGIGNACDADLTDDCAVNFEDLGAMKAEFFTADDDADLNGDGSVNFTDLGIMKEGFFAPPGPSGVPNICDGS